MHVLHYNLKAMVGALHWQANGFPFRLSTDCPTININVVLAMATAFVADIC